MKIFLRLHSEVFSIFCSKIFILYFCIGYDKNGDGKVTVSEFKRVMTRTSHLSDKDIEEMIRKADVDKDGSG